jgi:pimeloyl-ACP methyl ester carboxylesterase
MIEQKKCRTALPIGRGTAVRIGLLVAGLAAVASAAAAPVGAQATSAERVVLGAGDTVAVTSTGRGQAVVIVPGLLGSSYTFRHVTARLVADGYRVVVIEPLGTGASARPQRADYSLEAQAARVDSAMEVAGIGSAILVCHSASGSICYRLALRDPQSVSGIIAINGGPDERASTPGLRFALRFAPLARLLGGMRSARGRVRDGLRKGSADPTWVTEEVVDGYTRPFGDMDAALRGLRGMAAARDTAPLAPRLRELEVPVRLLLGAARVDGTTSDAEVEALRAIPDFTVTRVDGAGVYIQEERPDAVVDAVRVLSAAMSAGAAQARHRKLR